MRDVRDAVATPGRAGRVSLLGGRPCLNFVNTVEPRVETVPDRRPHDYLAGYADLIAWSVHAGLLSETAAGELLEEAAARPAAADAVLRRAVVLREACYEVFLAIARGEAPPAAAQATLSDAYAAAMGNARLHSTVEGFELGWREDPTALDRPLWPIARSAFEVLTGDDLRRVKVCPTDEEGCGWLFYDSGKNRSRRWCSMRGCGTAAKERRRAERRRGAATQT